MAKRTLLYLNALQLSAYGWQAGKLLAEGDFPNTAAGRNAFRLYLESRRQHLFYLLTNVAEEGFQHDAIPFLRGQDRTTVIARKLTQHFHTTPLTVAMSMGYEQTRRKNECLFLAALTDPRPILPWTNMLQETGACLVGVYSLALLSRALLRQLHRSKEQEPCLLLTLQDQSLRQSLFENDELSFSRLTPLHDFSSAGIAQAISSEAARLHQYLENQRHTPWHHRLKVYALVHSQVRPAVAAACQPTPALDFDIIANDEVGSRIGRDICLQDSRSEILWLHLLATSPPRQQFAAPALRRDYRIWQLKTGLSRGAVGFFLVCLLFAGQRFYLGQSLTQEAAAIQAEADGIRQSYDELAQTLPRLPVDHEQLHQIISRYERLKKETGDPEYLLRRLSQALEAAPQIEVESLAWQQGGAPASLPIPGKIPAHGVNQSESALLRGSIATPPDTKPRQVQDIFERFTKQLQAVPDIQIKVQQQPFDAEAGKSLKGSGEQALAAGPRPFSLQISRKGAG
ncbi:MAG TPA: hypothetical protein VJ548_12530 [Azospira sp.]|nr:hypothetical protein [Azospira sp.]